MQSAKQQLEQQLRYTQQATGVARKSAPKRRAPRRKKSDDSPE